MELVELDPVVDVPVREPIWLLELVEVDGVVELVPELNDPEPDKLPEPLAVPLNVLVLDPELEAEGRVLVLLEVEGDVLDEPIWLLEVDEDGDVVEVCSSWLPVLGRDVPVAEPDDGVDDVDD